MIAMDQYEFIRTAHRVYGKSIRQLERETGHDRKTIRKVLSGEPCSYPKRESQPYPALGEYVEVIDGWLGADREAPRKQRHTAARIFRRLVSEHGFTGSESTVRQYVRQAKLRLGVEAGRAFLPLEPDCGREAEVDWGSAEAILCGEAVRLKFFCMRSKYSGKHFVRLYPCERQQAFFDAHMRGFAFFGGVFPTIVYDNLTTAVQKVVRGRERVEQEAFRRMHSFYSFTPRFCNVASGNEKGGVEGLVGFARRNYMVPVPQAKSLEALNEKLLMDCMAYGEHRMAGRQQSVSELYEAEKSQLIALPDIPFSNIEICSPGVDKYATVIIDKNHYSVPTRYARLKARAIIHVDRVEIFYGSKKVAGHRRLFGNNKWSMDPEHYLELIQQRPQSFDTARPILQWRKSWPHCLEQLLERFCCKQGTTKGIKDFISVLMLYKEFDAQDIQTAVELALTAEAGSSAAVEHILRHSSKGSHKFDSLENWQKLPPADVSVYGQIGGGL